MSLNFSSALCAERDEREGLASDFLAKGRACGTKRSYGVIPYADEIDAIYFSILMSYWNFKELPSFS